MNLLKLFQRSKPDSELARRSVLKEKGRISEATITDIATDDDGRTTVVYYVYEISGVDYESSHALDDEQQARPQRYAPGATVNIRYDPRYPGNTIVE